MFGGFLGHLKCDTHILNVQTYLSWASLSVLDIQRIVVSFRLHRYLSVYYVLYIYNIIFVAIAFI